MLKVLLINADQLFVGREEQEKATFQRTTVKIVAAYGNRLNDNMA